MQFPFWFGSWYLPSSYNTILLADFDGDGKAELLGRTSGGMLAYQYDPSIGQFRDQFYDPNLQAWVTMAGGWPTFV